MLSRVMAELVVGAVGVVVAVVWSAIGGAEGLAEWIGVGAGAAGMAVLGMAMRSISRGEQRWSELVDSLQEQLEMCHRLLREAWGDIE